LRLESFSLASSYSHLQFLYSENDDILPSERIDHSILALLVSESGAVLALLGSILDGAVN
jgi:hypothetical protein